MTTAILMFAVCAAPLVIWWVKREREIIRERRSGRWLDGALRAMRDKLS